LIGSNLPNDYSLAGRPLNSRSFLALEREPPPPEAEKRPRRFKFAEVPVARVGKQSQLRRLNTRRIAMPSEGGFSFANFLTDVLTVFVFVVWFWLLIIVFSDLFRRQDISGWGKTLWVIVLIVFPYLGVFGYMIFQGRGMAERSSQQVQQTRDELRHIVGFSVADEIKKLDQLKKSGAITEDEFARLRAKLVQ
jgi:putative oligomerization/nucleic acid binding protein/phospholipase D-like protein